VRESDKNYSMRAIWKGAISFGLVNIPVGLYTASRSRNELKLNMLRDSDMSPIRYKRVAEVDQKEVPWEHIVKGYEYEKGQYVVLTDKDLERVNIKSNQMVDIREFVQLDEIDPMFFDEPYYLAPEKGGEKAYALLRDALKDSGKVGIAKVSIRTREHLAAVKPNGNTLVLELMHFPDELADTKELPVPDKVQVGKKEMTMAGSLIEGMTDKWDPEKYHDEYKQALLKLIEEKVAAGGKELPVEKGARPKATKVIDLVSVLQQSLKQAGKKGGAKKASHTKEHHAKRRKAA
jgi:DNA end-binding protein Ku